MHGLTPGLAPCLGLVRVNDGMPSGLLCYYICFAAFLCFTESICSLISIRSPSAAMPTNPQWVKDLKPASPQGSELLQKERDGSNINVNAISEFLHTKKELERKKRVLKVLENEPVFDKSQNYFAGRIDRFETSLARAKRLRQLTVKLGWDKDDFNTANELLSESTPYRLHDSMFLVCRAKLWQALHTLS